ncbi:MAG: RES family NAD+ phosphorylase [Acidobacteria bacterium]|nr:RES family NAD+ phosphorylase [Acidobacteriota bacterium]
MNAKACITLPTVSEKGVWYRAIQPHFLATALATSHTKTNPSRFNAGRLLSPPDQFRMLYLAENPMLALFEVQALLGSPMTPGGIVPHPRRAWTILNIAVNLRAVADMTDTASHQPMSGVDTSAQELTGDWRGYQLRSALTSVIAPTGSAPTQDLGRELYVAGSFEGFLAVSAKLPDQKNLIVFPDRLQPNSDVTFINSATGQTHSITDYV